MPKQRKLEPEGWVALERAIEEHKVLANAFRLMRDANILFDAGSYASTVGLAIISIEEIGKHLLATWSTSDREFTYDRRRLHIMKQCAVAALLMTDSARREYKDKHINFAALTTSEKVAELARAVLAGFERERPFAEAALNKVVEMSKWSGLYFNQHLAEKGVEPANITAGQATSVMESVSKAFMSLADEKTVSIAKYAFPYFYKTPLSGVPACDPRPGNRDREGVA